MSIFRTSRTIPLRFLVAALSGALVGGCASPELTSATNPPKTAQQIDAEAQCRAQLGSDGVLPPKRFTTDSCTLWPDAAWGHCCVAHDIEYWCGGTAQQRAAADQRLQQCVAESGHPGMGTVMRIGTRLGGWWVLPVPWRWGYGWGWLESAP